MSCLIIIFFVNIISNICGITLPIVKIENGLIQGTYYETINGRIINAFLGIPFGKPPVGNLRFHHPLPATPWTGILYSNKTKSACLQFNHYLQVNKLNPIVGDEDCLYLNVYTPKISFNSNNTLMRVIVFIHGGAFMYGKSDGFTPKYLLDNNNFVFVTIPYRVGPFGFLSTEDNIVPGNNGLKDQVLALKWIKSNIKVFGGNPNDVTMVGLSAGGASVHLHYFSNMSKGLFNRGISLSGTAFCPWAKMDKPLEKTIKLAISLNCPINNTKELIDCLKNQDGKLILSKIQPLFMGWLYNPISPFAPTIEVDNEEQFLSGNPYNLMKQGKIQDLPWLVGFTTEEGLYPASEFILNKKLLNELNNDWFIKAPHLLNFNYTVDDKEEQVILSERIKKFYLNKEKISLNNKKKLVKMISDRMYINAIDKAVKMQATVLKSPIYLYNFAYRGKYSLSDMFTGVKKNVGVSHGDDVAYVLNCYFSCHDNKNDKLMIKTMVNIWSTFITNGTPSIINSNLKWEPVVLNNNNCNRNTNNKYINYLYIKSTDNIKMLSNRNLGNNLFWNSLNLNEPFSNHDEL